MTVRREEGYSFKALVASQGHHRRPEPLQAAVVAEGVDDEGTAAVELGGRRTITSSAVHRTCIQHRSESALSSTEKARVYCTDLARVDQGASRVVDVRVVGEEDVERRARTVGDALAAVPRLYDVRDLAVLPSDTEAQRLRDC